MRSSARPPPRGEPRPIRPHPTHAHLDRALEWIARARPKRAILTNMHIDLDYRQLLQELPDGVEPAYDGMVISHELKAENT